MSLYTINRDLEDAILAGINPETGELDNFEAVQQISMERFDKIDNICSYIKNCRSDADAIDVEVKNLSDRRDSLRRKADCLELYLKTNVEPEEKFESARNKLKWTSGIAVEVNEKLLPKKYFRKKVVVEPDKANLKTLLKQGAKIKGASLIKTIGMKVK